jgi:hypothetical protein
MGPELSTLKSLGIYPILSLEGSVAMFSDLRERRKPMSKRWTACAFGYTLGSACENEVYAHKLIKPSFIVVRASFLDNGMD